MPPVTPHPSPQERARLARKGALLCEKSCGSGGEGACAEAFAAHQLRHGRAEVVRDLLRSLEGRIAVLRVDDPGGRLPAAEALAARIRRRLDES